ncbi:sporulation and spore germination protein [Homoserinimonas aerilata]|uniref:Sporulation and spore germination protein n=1 Tax=Homoserinimonas aerilata TaxID=1162970 RepID=A0A542YKH3_9MICO|nr:LpqB family beta-propeller domain-containing protein [Homoserinimonas aerilata]TQL48593.1 sporulation and spore germination protein [Homoserinimonas aerilata]
MRSSRMPRRIAAVAVVFVLGSLLSACVGIPSSGGVMTGDEVSQRDTGEDAEFVISGPAPGSDRETILRGFIDAFKSSGDYDVARQFLSSSFVNEWEPRGSVLLRSGPERFVTIDESTMQYVVSTRASVDSAGVYTAFPSAPSTLQFQFVKEGGEWRISSAPSGIVLSTSAFGRIFGEHALYFLDPSGTSLVPDVRWFPAGTAATRIASALLAGPPAWLQGAVKTAFPDGTQLSSPKRVVAEEDTAIVDLTSAALTATESQRQLMRLQLTASLGTVASLPNVRMSVNGAPMELGDPGTGLPQAHPQVDSRPLLFHDGEFGFYANGQISPVDTLSAKIAGLSPSAVTLGTGGTAAAVLGVGGVSVVRANQASPAPLDSRPGLIAPALDSYNYVWSVPADDPTALRAFDFEGSSFAVATNLPADARIVSVDVARDGARVAILLSTSVGPRLIVAAINRDANNAQAPLALGEPIVDTIASEGTALDATWLDETTVATLTVLDETTVATAYKVGGDRTSLGSPGNAVQIVGGNTESGLRALGADGVVSALRDSGWQSTQAQAQFIATQR